MEEMHITVREASKQDAEKIIEFMTKIASESKFLTFGEGEFQTSVEEEEDIIEMSLEDPLSLFLVAEDKGKIIANLHFSSGIRSKTKHFGKFGITVLKDYWGLGIARKMLTQMIAWARANNVTRKINLDVREDNIYAIQLYKKLGFVTEGKISRYYLEDNQYYGAVVMGLELDNYQEKSDYDHIEYYYK